MSLPGGSYVQLGLQGSVTRAVLKVGSLDEQQRWGDRVGKQLLRPCPPLHSDILERGAPATGFRQSSR